MRSSARPNTPQTIAARHRAWRTKSKSTIFSKGGALHGLTNKGAPRRTRPVCDRGRNKRQDGRHVNENALFSLLLLGRHTDLASRSATCHANRDAQARMAPALSRRAGIHVRARHQSLRTMQARSGQARHLTRRDTTTAQTLLLSWTQYAGRLP